jgi:hypothetical protein
MTRQEMFDKAYLGMLKQGGLAQAKDGGCYYTNPTTGRHCAVGLLLDEQTLAQLELDRRNSAGVASITDYLPDDFDVDFAAELQHAHDQARGPDDLPGFISAMEQIAKLYDLTIPTLIPA